ncbi:pyridoxal phosphate-dependent aminotransferase [Pseudoxanthomonas daejeonensis]|uniref:pyridoxal phosphate-dependent aminotransferase n=1 Tax=Pseudoxanthomonas daejeonensis TaxID=266062 RepID=UPI001F53E70A|nr:pyridoxal phosphate-dependent aminotransferase [Pseudoxanthomonas daejeonensis]UNK57096.1 pyridoxal phosphate-dependent aminotransferase [Pseudoxanthomonas daejeonensis]
MAHPLSRRHFLGLSACSLATAGLAPLIGSGGMARAQLPPSIPGMDDPDAVLLNFNENPHGPFAEAQQAAADGLVQANRYLFGPQRELVQVFAGQNGLRDDQVAGYCGSGVALDSAALAFTSPRSALVIADPTFESLAQMADAHGAKVVRVPLKADGAHDVQAMAAAAKASTAGLIYICNPNNPTGSVTPRADIDWLLAHKPADAVLLVDEAYIHYSDEPDTLDLVRAGADVVVLRTFSKIYGMAGMRLGLAMARPDLLQRLVLFGVNSLPVPSVAAGIASLRNPQHLATRKAENTRLRGETVAWLAARGHGCLPSQANCFMVDVKGDGRAFAAKMAQHKVFIGRSWPSMPQHVRITVGTEAEMARFREVFAQVGAAT